MTGGLIDSEDGFAVEVNDGGSFQMTGGVARAEDYSAIMGDDSSNRGDTRILIDGGYVLSVNTVTSGSFVGVGACQVMEGGILQMDSGTIRAVGNGVGAIVEYGSFRLNDGEIYGDGTDFSGETAGRIPIDDGYGLVLYAAKAGTEINGGFISGMEGDDGSYPVPSVKIADAVASSANGARTMGAEELEPVNPGVEIKGGTYTNFDGMDSYVAEGYRKLGHSADGRGSWVTVMQLVTESQTKTGNSVSGSVITGKTAYVFYGQMDYYRGNIAKETVEYVRAGDGGALTELSASVYVDYPVFGNEYVFSGWFTDLEATQEKKPSGGMVQDNVTDGDAYAKLSDAELMHVVFNTSSNLWDGVKGNDDTAQLTAFALVDSASFEDVGLRTQFGDGTKHPEYTQYRALAKMPESLDYVDQYNNRQTQWAYQLNPVATYISGARLSDISTTDEIDDLYYAYQWWITIDGTHVEGSWWNMSILSYLKANYPENDLGVK